MDARSLFICSICNDYLNNPVNLPCHCTICKHHLDKDVIECKFCNEIFNLPHDGIRENKRIKLIIESNGHLSEDEKNFRQNIQKSLTLLENLYSEYNTKEFELENFHLKHFQKIEDSVHERCEHLKAKLDEIANDMVARINSLKIQYQEQKSSNRPFTSNEEFQIVFEKFKNPNLNYKRTEQVQLELTENIEMLTNRITEIDTWKIQLDGHHLTDHDYRFLEQSFGSLKLPGITMNDESSAPSSNSGIKTESKSETENQTTGDSDLSSNIDEPFILVSDDEKEIEQSNNLNYSSDSRRLSNSNTKKVSLEYYYSNNELDISESKSGLLTHAFGVLSQKKLEINRDYPIDPFYQKINQIEIPNFIAKIPASFPTQRSFSNFDYEENQDESMNRSNSQNRRARINYTSDQVQVLEETFKNQKYPQPDLIDHLSKKLQLCNSRISIWFQNRRAKDKNRQK
jgi:hypothetical protein